MIRCKFFCQAVSKRKHWDRNEKRFMFDAEFAAVSDGSEENKKFFEYTPNGTLRIGTYKEDHFEPGKAYYIDISEAPE